jgi:hypothetical protein
MRCARPSRAITQASRSPLSESSAAGEAPPTYRGPRVPRGSWRGAQGVPQDPRDPLGYQLCGCCMHDVLKHVHLGPGIFFHGGVFFFDGGLSVITLPKTAPRTYKWSRKTRPVFLYNL